MHSAKYPPGFSSLLIKSPAFLKALLEQHFLHNTQTAKNFNIKGAVRFFQKYYFDC